MADDQVDTEGADLSKVKAAVAMAQQSDLDKIRGSITGAYTNRGAAAVPGANVPPAMTEGAAGVEEMLRLPPGRFQAAAAASKPPSDLGLIASARGALDAAKYMQVAGIGRPPNYEELASSPATAPSIQAFDKAAQQSQQTSDLKYGPQPDPSVYQRALSKLADQKAKEVTQERAAVREQVRNGYWPLDQLGPPPDWATRTSADFPGNPPPAPPATQMSENAPASAAAYSKLKIDLGPQSQAISAAKTAKDWLAAKETAEVQSEAEKRAAASAIPGIHSPPLGKKDVANLVWQLTQARAAGQEAAFSAAHPYLDAAVREAGSMGPFLGAGAVIGPAIEGIGVASAPLRGALEMAALDTGDQIARIRSGAQQDYDPVRALSAVSTFAGAAAIGQKVADWALTRRITALTEQAGGEAVADAANAIPTATKGQVANLTGQQAELIKRLEAARQAASRLGAGANMAAFTTINAAQQILADANKGQLGGEVGVTGTRAAVDILMSLAAAKAFPAHVTEEKAREAASKIADVEAETMRRMASERPDTPVPTPPDQTKSGIPASIAHPVVPEDPGGFDKAQQAWGADFDQATKDGKGDHAASLATPEVLQKYGDAYSLSGEDRVRLRNLAEERATRPDGAAEPATERPQETRAAVPEEPAAAAQERRQDVERASDAVVGPKLEPRPASQGSRLDAVVGARNAAVEGGDADLASKLAAAHEIVDRMETKGTATVRTEDLADLAKTASDASELPEDSTVKQAVATAQGQRALNDAVGKAVEARSGRIDRGMKQKNKATGAADGPSVRAAWTIEVGGDAQIVRPDGEVSSLGAAGRADLANQLRRGQIRAEAGAAREEGRKGLLLGLSDGSVVRVGKPDAEPGSGMDQAWSSIHEAYERVEKQGGMAFVGSSRAEIAFQRAIEHQLVEDAHLIFQKDFVEKGLRGVLESLPTKVGPDVRDLILNFLGYDKSPGAVEGLRLGGEEADAWKAKLEQAWGPLREYAAKYKNGSELLSVLAEMHQRKGEAEGKLAWKPEILRKGQELMEPLLNVADQIGKRLYDLERLPWAVHESLTGKANLRVMKGDRELYESNPPDPKKWGPLKGGVSFYEKEGYLTHTLAREVMREVQAGDGSLRPVSKLGALTNSLKQLAKTAFRSRRYTDGEEAYQHGVRASVPRTVETLTREIGGIMEARAQNYLADVGLIVKIKPDETRGADVKQAKLELTKHHDAATDLMHAKLAEAEQARRAGDNATFARALSEAGVAKQMLAEVHSRLMTADRMTSGWKQVTGLEWGKHSGWFIRNDALHTLQTRQGQMNAWTRLLTAFTGAQRILRNRYSAFFQPINNWFSNLDGNAELLGANPYGEATGTNINSFRNMWNHLFKGQTVNEPVLRELIARGKIQTASGQSENFLAGSAERAFKMSEAASKDGRSGDALAHWLEGMVHTIASYPEKLPGAAGKAFRLNAILNEFTDAAPYYAAVRQMVEGKGTLYGRPLSMDEAITRAGRLYDFSRINPAARALMRAGLSLAGYSGKVGEALFGPPPKPAFLGMPLPFSRQLAWTMRDPTSKAGKLAYAAYKTYSFAGAVVSSLAPYMLAGYAARKVFTPGLSAQQIDDAKDDTLRAESKGWLARAVARPFLLPIGIGKDNRVEFVDMRPFSWLGAVADFGSGWFGNHMVGPNGVSMAAAIMDKTIWGRAIRDAYEPETGAELPADKVRNNPMTQIALLTAPGVVSRSILEAIRQWKDAGEADVVPWPESVLKVLTGIRIMRGDPSEWNAKYGQLQQSGHYKMTPGDLVPKDPTDTDAIMAQRLHGTGFQSSQGNMDLQMNALKRKIQSIGSQKP